MAAGSSDNFVADLTGHISVLRRNLIVFSIFCTSKPQPVDYLWQAARCGGDVGGTLDSTQR